MPNISLNGNTIEIDEDGFLVNMDDWTKELAEVIAKNDDIELTEEHWQVLNFLRDYYQEYKIAPMIKILTKAMAQKMDKDRKEMSKHLYTLFPGGPAKDACRIAGLPKPTGCV